MSYSLETIHGLIDSWLAEKPEMNLTDNNGKKVSAIHKALAEAASLNLQFMRQIAAGADTREAFKINMEITVAGCTDLINKLDRHKKGELAAIPKDKDRMNALDELEEALTEHSNWLRNSFPSCFPGDQSLPLITAEREAEALGWTWQQLKEGLESSGIDAELITIVKAPVQELTDNRITSLTYHRLAYLRNLYTALEKWVNANSMGRAEVTSLTDTLIFHNFNCPALIRYTVEKYRQEAPALSSLSDSLEYWNNLARWLEQVPALGMALNTSLPSVKESLAAVIRAEINYARTREETLAAIYGGRISNKISQPAKSNQIATTLSVSQLGVWFRLFNDCGMIQHNNQTELLKRVATALQTTRTTCISAESLRVKYYAPEPAAINIVKEHLHQMLNQLKKY